MNCYRQSSIPQTSYPLGEAEEESVAIRKEDWESINHAIADAVAPLKPSGWKKALHLLREWSVLGTAATLIVALVALAAAAFYQAFARVDKQARFETTTEDTLKGIQSEIVEVRGQLAKLNVTSHTALPQAEFKNTLLDLSSAIATVQQQHIKLSPAVLSDLSQKLVNTDTNAPAFWPTVAVVISYRSEALVGGIQNWQKQFPLCPGTVDILGADKNAAAQLLGPDHKPTGPKVSIKRIGNQDCYVELDGKTISGWDCKRCLVKYSGGSVSMTDVHFEDCLFVFDFRSGHTPTPDGQRLTKTLLASELTDVAIPVT